MPELAPQSEEPTAPPRWCVLLVGDEPTREPLVEALRARGMDAICARTAEGVHAVVAEAPDLVVVLGASPEAPEAGLSALHQQPESATLPIVLLGDAPSAAPAPAFTQGVVGHVRRGLGASAIASELERILCELPSRPGTAGGGVDEASLDALVDVLARELRSGVLSIHGVRDAGLLLRSGRPVGETLEQFVERARPIVSEGDAVRYAFWEQPGGRLASVRGPQDAAQSAGGGVRGEATDATEALAGCRIVVVHRDRAVAEAWSAALESAGARPMCLSLRSRIQPLRSFDPQVVLVPPSALEDPEDRLLSIVQRDARLRWAATLVAPVEALQHPCEGARYLPALAREVHALCRPHRELAQRIDAGAPFETRLETLGPAQLLRVVQESGQAVRFDVEHAHAVIGLELSDGRLATVRALRRDRGTETLVGAEALDLLLCLRSGKVRVRPGATREVSSAALELDLDRFRLGRPTPLPSGAPSPLLSSIPPPPGVPVEAERHLLRTTLTLPSPAEARSFLSPLAIAAASALLLALVVAMAMH